MRRTSISSSSSSRRRRRRCRPRVVNDSFDLLLKFVVLGHLVMEVAIFDVKNGLSAKNDAQRWFQILYWTLVSPF